MVSFKQFAESISLQYHDKLNPKLWNQDQTLKPEVREALLRFAWTWVDFAKIPSDLVQDIIFVGGNANFNYTSQSDCDVHVIIDKRLFGVETWFVDEYMKTKKSLWGATHKVTVKGYNVEPYTQGLGEDYPTGQGVYSLLRGDWVLRPVHGHPDVRGVERRANDLEHQIYQLIATRADVSVAKEMKDRLNSMRAAGIEKAGEFSRENLIFKELRNRGVVDALKNYISTEKDHSLSLE